MTRRHCKCYMDGVSRKPIVDGMDHLRSQALSLVHLLPGLPDLLRCIAASGKYPIHLHNVCVCVGGGDFPIGCRGVWGAELPSFAQY